MRRVARSGRPRSLAVLAGVILGTAACSAGTTGSTQPTESANRPAATATAASSAPPAALSGEIVFPSHIWAGATGETVFYPYVEEFTADHPDVEIVPSDVPFADYHNKVFTDIAAGNAPDIVVPYDPQITPWIELGLLEPLNPWLEAAGYDLDTILEDWVAPQQLAIKDGQIYAVLLHSNPRALVYNEDLLDGAGVAVPTTPEELLSAAEALRDEGNQQFGFATMSGSATADITFLEIMPIINGFGGAFVTDGQPTANSPETVAALEFIEQMYDQELIPLGVDHTVYREAFIQGKIAALTIGAFIIGQAGANNPDIVPSLAAAPLPFANEQSIAVNVFLGVPTDSENKDAAAAFIIGLLDDAKQGDLAISGTAIPARRGTVPAEYVAENPWFQAIVDAGDTAVSYAPRGAEQEMTEVMEIVTTQYQAMLFGDLTAQQAADQMQEELAQLLQ